MCQVMMIDDHKSHVLYYFLQQWKHYKVYANYFLFISNTVQSQCEGKHTYVGKYKYS